MRRAAIVRFLAAGALALVTAVGFTVLLRSTADSDLCGTELLRLVPAPDRTTNVAVLRRDCGATTGFSVQLAVLPTSERPSSTTKAFFIADDNRGEAPSALADLGVTARWRGDHSIEVAHSKRVRVFRADSVASGVGISYAVGR